ncbi:hypothetical protein B5M09_010944, partial [Aphanomyces astaci]
MEQFYAGKGLFVTGGTGFIGKTLIEKLLRSTPDIDKIYVMVRPKKGRSAHDRLESDIISSPIFNRLRAERPADFDSFIRSKLVAIGGDINSASLGMSAQDAQLLIDRVNVVVHSAASVSFNEPLDVAVEQASSTEDIEKLHLNLIGTYPNTYTLTKSMAEHMLAKHRAHVDQLAAAGAIFLAGGMGLLTILPGDPRSIADIVPVDFVVNAILLSAFAKAKEPTGAAPLIVHSGTSDPREQPLRWRVPIGTVFLRYTLPSSAYSTIANASGNVHHMNQASRLWKLTWRARQLVEIFKPFTENQWVFSADGLQTLRAMPEYNSTHWWCFMALSTERMLAWDPDHHAISFPGLLPDMSWAFTSSRKPGYTKAGIWGRFMGLTGWKEGAHHEATYVPRVPADPLSAIKHHVLHSQAVQTVIENAEKAAPNKEVRALMEAQVLEMLSKMAATVNYKSVRVAGWLLRKVLYVWRQMYDKIIVDEGGLETIRNLVKAREGPLVLIPTHRSYIDFLMMTYLFFAYNIPVPHIFAGEDFLNMGPMTQVLREGGAFFVRRSFKDDALYTAVFSEYTQ